ncbi:MAG: hypothetical protein AAFY72_06845 [Cyanobacteria bacterium J06649_4]
MKITPSKITIDNKKYPKIIADIEVGKTPYTGCEHEGLSPLDENFLSKIYQFIEPITVSADLGDGWATALLEDEGRISAITFKPAGLHFQLVRLIKFEGDDSQSLKTSAMVTYYSMTRDQADTAGQLIDLVKKYLTETPVQGDILSSADDSADESSDIPEAT